MVEKLDLLDKKVLFELDFDSRVPVSRLAKKLRVGRNVVEYRINKLVERGVIKNFYPLIDPGKLGLTIWNVYLQCQNLTPKTEKQVLNYLVKNKRVWWIAQTTGNWELIYSIYVRHIKEFYEVVSDFNAKFGDFILNQSVVAHVDVEVFSRGYFLNKPSVGVGWYKTFEHQSLDEADKKILRELFLNARTPSVEIARKLGLTARIVVYRIKDLVRRGIISRFRIVLDQNKIGMGYYKVILFLKNLSKEQDKSLEEYCRLAGNIFYFERKIGPWMLELELDGESYEKVNEQLKKMKGRFPNYIKNYSIHLIYNELKGEYDLTQEYV